MKPVLKAPGTMLLKLIYDEPLSNFAFNFNLRRFIMVADRQGGGGAPPPDAGAGGPPPPDDRPCSPPPASPPLLKEPTDSMKMLRLLVEEGGGSRAVSWTFDAFAFSEEFYTPLAIMSLHAIDRRGLIQAGGVLRTSTQPTMNLLLFLRLSI